MPKHSRMVVASLYVLLGLAVSWFARRSRGISLFGPAWPSVPGTILERSVRLRSGGQAAQLRYVPRVKYEYTVQGRTCSGERVYLDDDELEGSETRAEMERFVAALPSPLPVHYDPEDVASGYLLSSNPAWVYWTLRVLGALAVLLGGVQLAFAVFAVG